MGRRLAGDTVRTALFRGADATPGESAGQPAGFRASGRCRDA